MVQGVFRGGIEKPGRFVALDPVRFQAWLRQHIGKKVEVVLREPQPQRSLDQNDYLHAIPFRLIADYTGDDIGDIKLALMGECWGWTFSKIANREVPVKPNTSSMTVKECDHFIEWLVPWAAQHLELVIPFPSELVPR